MEEKLLWISHHWTGNAFIPGFKRLVFAVMVYNISKAGNAALFQSKTVNNIGIVLAIGDEVQHVMLDWDEIPKNHITWQLGLQWSLTPKCFF